MNLNLDLNLIFSYVGIDRNDCGVVVNNIEIHVLCHNNILVRVQLILQPKILRIHALF